MKIATIINTHDYPDMVSDTLEAIHMWIGENTLVVVDKAGWDHFKDFKYKNTPIICGVFHQAKRSPYKNVAIGFREAYERWPDCDWYCYLELDVLVISDGFKADLKKAATAGCSFVGSQTHIKHGSNDHWMTRQLMDDCYRIDCVKSLGAMMFYSHRCVAKLVEMDFYNRLLKVTEDFRGDYFPNFGDYAVEEVIFPSAATAFGKALEIKSFNSSPSAYPVVWGHEVLPEAITPSTIFVHPVKTYDHPIRVFYRKQRKLF